MKSINILRMHPGVEVQTKALEMFLKYGPSSGTEWMMVDGNGKTFVTLSDLDSLDRVSLAAYAPFFDIETIPVSEMNDEVIAAFKAAVARHG